ncbi:MAG: DUF1330 domain-containing protein [Pseudomonadota bacterium]
MTTTHELRVAQFIEAYGDGSDGASPTVNQWRHILTRDPAQPVTLVNLFKMRPQAQYRDSRSMSVTGQEAFDRYAEVSIPSLEQVGGKFLLVAPYEAIMVGAEEQWDLIAIGSYPSTTALIALFESPAYCAAFAHRVAACALQKVYVCNG